MQPTHEGRPPGPGIAQRIELFAGDITSLPVDAIVNAANSELRPGGGVCGAIHGAAGPELAAECRTLGGCPTGEAKLTRGYRLPARYVLHTVGPVWHGGRSGEPAQLASCYRRCCELAVAHGLRTLAFPAISTGIFGYPLAEATTLAVETVLDFLAAHPELHKVTLVCYGDAAMQTARPILDAALRARAGTAVPSGGSVRPQSDRRRERILGGLWGSVVGDALGVPVEFSQRAERDADPVRELRGFGTYQQPPGTWSDDSSLMLCSLHSLLLPRLDLADMGARFVRYVDEAYMTPHGYVFDIGGATARSIGRLKRGVSPLEAGGTEDRDNGNGSLMRILPVALRFLGSSDEELIDAAHKISGLTHRHPRSQLACGYFCLLLRQLLAGHPPAVAYERANQLAARLYQGPPWQAELPHLRRVLSGAVPGLPRDEVSGSGYVVHTLEAAIWCLLRHPSFDAAVFAAINLGDDTDTTACVTGGLVGVALGLAAVPSGWRTAMARHGELADWFSRFADVALQPG